MLFRSARRGELSRVVAQRALTERAERLDGEIGRLREQLAKVAPVVNVNPQASALARLFQLPDADAAVYQYLAVAVVVELLIAGSFIAVELMRETGLAAPATLAAAVATGEGAPEKFCAEGLRRRPGKWVSPEPVYPAYEAWCRRFGLQAVADEIFVDRFFAACDARGIRRETRGGVVYLADVELAA